MHGERTLKFAKGTLYYGDGRGTDSQNVRDFNVRCLGWYIWAEESHLAQIGFGDNSWTYELDNSP